METLTSKFEHSWKDFRKPRSKIEYALRFLFDDAYEVVCKRCGPSSSDAYQTIEELISDLKFNFGDKDEWMDVRHRMMHPQFVMGFKDFKETFDKLIIRFNRDINQTNWDPSAAGCLIIISLQHV